MPLDLLLLSGLLAAAPASLTVEGEHFTPRQIVDPQQHGMVAVAFMAPEKWKDSSQVSWNYADINSPVTVRLKVENPANAEAYYLHPAAKYFALRPDGGLWKEGSDHGGWIKLRKQPPLPTLVAHVRKLRPGLADVRFVGSKDLPDLPKALQTEAGPNQTGQAVKVTYTLQGQAVEEDSTPCTTGSTSPTTARRAGAGRPTGDWSRSTASGRRPGRSSGARATTGRTATARTDIRTT